MLDALDKAAVSYQIVLTKADELKPSELERRMAETAAADRQAAGGLSRDPADLEPRRHGRAGIARRHRPALG